MDEYMNNALNEIGDLLREAYEEDPSSAPLLEELAKIVTVVSDLPTYCTTEEISTANYNYIFGTTPDPGSDNYVVIVSIEDRKTDKSTPPIVIFKSSRLNALRTQHTQVEHFLLDPNYEPTEFYDIDDKRTISIKEV